MAVISTRTKRYMEARLRNEERKEDRARNETGTRFADPCPPLLVRFTHDQSKLPASIAIQLPHDTAIAAIHRGRTLALPVGSFDAVPDLEVDDQNLEHVGLDFVVA